MIKWGNKDTAEVWLRWNDRMACEDPGKQVHRQYTTNVESKKCVLQFLHAAELASEAQDSFDLSGTTLILHVIGASADYEGHSEWEGLFQRLPGLRKLQVVLVGFVGKNHKTQNWQDHLAMDEEYLEKNGPVTRKSFGGGKTTLEITRFQGTYCQFREAQGGIYQAPDAAILFNPGLDVYFDAWAPTIAGLIDDATLIIITGYLQDSSNVYNPQVMDVLGAATVVPITSGKFPYYNGMVTKSANVMVTKGGTASHDFIASKHKLKEIDPQETGQSSFWDDDLGLY